LFFFHFVIPAKAEVLLTAGKKSLEILAIAGQARNDNLYKFNNTV